MNCIRELELSIFKKASIILASLVFISLVLNRTHINMGLLVGFFIGIFHFKLIVFSVKRLTDIRRINLVRGFSSLSCLFRFALLGFLFWLASTRDLVFFTGVALGFFTIKASIILEGFNKIYHGKFSQDSHI